jgi:[ribosomal protein S5]-alanine N-acetyltransferase
MPSEIPIVLETPRLILRTMKGSDVDPLLSIFGDVRVMEMFDAAPFDRQTMIGWVQRNLDHQAVHGYGLFSVILKPDNLLIGDCGLEQMDVEGSAAAELGYDFRSEYWNQGYATEAASAVRDFAFRQLQLPQLVSLIRQSNLPSQRVSEKIGMKRLRELTRYESPYWLYGLPHPDTADAPSAIPGL